MSPDPYRTPADDEPDSAEPEPFLWYDVTAVAALTFLLGAARITAALVRGEDSTPDLDLAWIFVLLIPIVVWKEIAANRQR